MSSTLIEPQVTVQRDWQPPSHFGFGAAEYDASARRAQEVAAIFSNEGALAAAGIADSVAQEQITRRNRSLSLARQELGSLSDDQKPIINEYFSHYFRGDPEAAGYDSWVSMLADDQYDPSGNLLMGVLSWHEAELEAQNTHNPEFTQAVADVQRKREHMKAQGVAEEWVSREAKIHHKAPRIVVGDVFDTVMHNQEAYWIRGSDFIVIAQVSPGEGIAGLKNRLKSRLFNHESNHEEFADGLRLAAYREEAMSETLALSMEDREEGRDIIIDPDNREQLGLPVGQYRPGRKLLTMELNQGWIQIDPKAMLRAYTSGNAQSRDFIEYDRLLDQAWDMHGFREYMDKQAADYEAWLRNIRPDWTEGKIEGQTALFMQRTLLKRAQSMQLLSNKVR